MPGFRSTVNPAAVSLSGQQLSIGSLIKTRLFPRDITEAEKVTDNNKFFNNTRG